MASIRRYRLTVVGPVPDILVGDLHARFGASMTPTTPPGNTVIDLGRVDQSALRAVLTWLWDRDQELLDLSADSG